MLKHHPAPESTRGTEWRNQGVAVETLAAKLHLHNLHRADHHAVFAHVSSLCGPFMISQPDHITVPANNVKMKAALYEKQNGSQDGDKKRKPT